MFTAAFLLCVSLVSLPAAQRSANASPAPVRHAPSTFKTDPVTFQKFPDVVYKTVGSLQIKLDIYVPEGPGMTGPFPGMVMVHGGGWADDSKDNIKQWAQDFALAGIVTYAIDFRESCDPLDPGPGDPPELCGYQFPVHLEDIDDAIVWVRQNAPLHPEWKTMANRVAVWGTSSGANLSANVGTGWEACAGLTIPANCPEGTPGWDKPDAVVEWSGAMDNVNGGGSSGVPDRGLAYLGCYPPPAPSGHEDQECPDQLMAQASPLYNISTDDPPMYLMQASNDPILPISEHAIPMDNAYVADGLTARLYEVNGTCHGIKCTNIDPNLEPDNEAWLHQILGPFAPSVPIMSGPENPTKQAQATFTFTPGAGVTTQCALDGAPLQPCTSPVTLTNVPPGAHQFKVVGTDSDQHTGDPSIYAWTVNATQVTIQNTGYHPASATTERNGWVQWNAGGTGTHTVTDASGMGLFDSGALTPGMSFRAVFPGAGSYAYKSTSDSSFNGTIKVGVAVTPSVGPPGAPFTITWAPGPPPSGFVYDVQIQKPGSTKWKSYRSGDTTGTATDSTSVTGTYKYRGRLRNASNGKFSGWSGASAINVTSQDLTPPVVTIDTEPTNPTTSTSATFGVSSNEPATFTCSLDGAPPSDCTTGAQSASTTYTGLASGMHTFDVIGTDTAGNVAAPVEYQWYVSPLTSVNIKDNGYMPGTVTVPMGTTVTWTNIGTRSHTVTDSTPLAQFDSGPLAPGGTFQWFFPGASTYKYTSTGDTGYNGMVKIPPIITPTSGDVNTSFDVRWAVLPPPNTLMYDVYIKPPGASSFTIWQLGQGGTDLPFVPATDQFGAGPGTYQFMVRLRDVSFNSPGFSPTVSITVNP